MKMPSTAMLMRMWWHHLETGVPLNLGRAPPGGLGGGALKRGGGGGQLGRLFRVGGCPKDLSDRPFPLQPINTNVRGLDNALNFTSVTAGALMAYIAQR